MRLYDDPAYYGMLFDGRENDLAFYREVAKAAGSPAKVLEYGIGNGRVAVALAREGHLVTGIDLSASMLAALAQRASTLPDDVRSRLDWHEGNAREVSLGKKFEVVICPFNGIAHHHQWDELGLFFERVHAHLAPGGVFAFDTLVPDPKLLAGVTSSVPWFRHPRDGVVSRCTEEISYDGMSQVLSIRTSVTAMEGEEREADVLTLRIRQFFPEETMLMLQHFGFTAERYELGDALGYVCRARLGG